MYLSEVRIKNFRCFDEKEHIIHLASGLNVLVGENDSGKSSIIDAIRIVLGTTDQGWYKIDSTDFYNEDREREISIICHFEDLNQSECAAFLEALSYLDNGKGLLPSLFLHWKCKYLRSYIPARTTTTVTTGISGDGPTPTPEARELLRVTYLRALRDAYSDMQSGRNSRLSQIVQSIPDLNSGIKEYSEGMDIEQLSITGIADLSNKLLVKHPALNKANHDVTSILQNKMLLHGDKLQTQIQVSGMDVHESKKLLSLLEKLDLTALSEDGRSFGHVGLGTSNIMSMACEMLLNSANAQNGRSSFLLIEEPEAHIHAQRQLRLIQSLQDEASRNLNQIIITTHSPILAAAVDLDNIRIICHTESFSLKKGLTLLSDDDYGYLGRYLDATKANLFFAKGVLIVEGPAEELMLPTVAKIIGRDFAQYGVSIVNVRGIGLRRFARIFQRKAETNLLPVPVACITDRDIMPDCAPSICINEAYTSLDKYPKNRRWRTESEFPSEDDKKAIIDSIKSKADGQNVKTFISDHWTLEYDMFYCGLHNEMLEALMRIKYVKENREIKLLEMKKCLDHYETPHGKAAYFYSYFYDNSTSKAEFAQTLASILSEQYIDKPLELIAKLPKYLVDATEYVTGS